MPAFTRKDETASQEMNSPHSNRRADGHKTGVISTNKRQVSVKPAYRNFLPAQAVNTVSIAHRSPPGAASIASTAHLRHTNPTIILR